VELASSTPAVLVLDLHMPARKRARAPAAASSLGVRASASCHVTGDYFVDEPAMREIQSLGAQVYFKPLWVEDMIQIIRALTSAGSDSDASRLT
jgi:DNA-binding NarL/FixJ family response regulator